MSIKRVFPFAAALGLVACGGTQPPGGTGPTPVTPDPIAPAETAKPTGEVAPAVCDAKVYPCGPYGYQQGDVIANLAFIGRADDNANGSVTDDSPRKFSMSDYYQNKDIKIVVLLVAAEWCPPCQREQGSLVSDWKLFNTMALPATFFEVLSQSTDGSPADLHTVDRWTSKGWTDYTNQNNPVSGLKIQFPTAADPGDLTLLLGSTAIPTQIYVKTADMTILDVTQGYGGGQSALLNATKSWLNNL